MATKTLTITEEAYNKLARLKVGKDSFSDVIVREFGGGDKVKLKDIFGIIKGKAGEELEKNILESRRKNSKITKKRKDWIVKELNK